MTGISQVIQVMGAMVLFSLILLNMNRFMMLNDLVLLQNRYEQVAMAAGQSIVNESRVKAFDEGTTSFTDPGKLGPEGYENRKDPSEPPFDDFDDYNGYTETKTINGINYQLDVSVCYVSRSDMDSCVGTVTDHKMLVVRVDNKFMDAPVRIRMFKSFY